MISESPSAAERPFAVGVDRTGWAQARSNAAGQVMIESPEYPRGLWLHLVDEAGQALAQPPVVTTNPTKTGDQVKPYFTHSVEK